MNWVLGSGAWPQLDPPTKTLVEYGNIGVPEILALFILGNNLIISNLTFSASVICIIL